MKEHEQYIYVKLLKRDFTLIFMPVEVVFIDRKKQAIFVAETAQNTIIGEPFRVDEQNLYKTYKKALNTTKYLLESLCLNIDDTIKNRVISKTIAGEHFIPTDPNYRS